MGAEVDTICIGTAVGPWKTHHDAEESRGAWGDFALLRFFRFGVLVFAVGEPSTRRWVGLA
jgi:hypothetical protein